MEPLHPLIIRLTSGDVPIYAQIDGRSVEIGRSQLDPAAVGALLRSRALDERYSDSLYRALNTLADNSYSDEQLGKTVSDMLINTVTPDAWVKLVVSFMPSETVVEQRIVAALDAATAGLLFCAVCRNGFHRTRTRHRTCGRERCARVVSRRRARKTPVSRAKYFQLRRQRAAFKRLHLALEAAVAPRTLKPSLVQGIDHDRQLTEWVERLATRHPALHHALSGVRRYTANRAGVARMKK